MINKTFGYIADFEYVTEDSTRIVVRYDCEETEDCKHATWQELVFYKKQGIPDLVKVKKAIIDGIMEVCCADIEDGLTWKGKAAHADAEFRQDLSDIQRVCDMTDGGNLPVTIILSVDKQANVISHTFKTKSELSDFYQCVVAHVQQCKAEAASKIENMDWSPYEILNPLPEVIIEEP